MHGAVLPNSIFLIAFLVNNLTLCQAGSLFFPSIVDLESAVKYFQLAKFNIVLKLFKPDFSKYISSLFIRLSNNIASQFKNMYDFVDQTESDKIAAGAHVLSRHTSSKRSISSFELIPASFWAEAHMTRKKDPPSEYEVSSANDLEYTIGSSVSGALKLLNSTEIHRKNQKKVKMKSSINEKAHSPNYVSAPSKTEIKNSAAENSAPTLLPNGYTTILVKTLPTQFSFGVTAGDLNTKVTTRAKHITNSSYLSSENRKNDAVNVKEMVYQTTNVTNIKTIERNIKNIDEFEYLETVYSEKNQNPRTEGFSLTWRITPSNIFNDTLRKLNVIKKESKTPMKLDVAHPEIVNSSRQDSYQQLSSRLGDPANKIGQENITTQKEFNNIYTTSGFPKSTVRPNSSIMEEDLKTTTETVTRGFVDFYVSDMTQQTLKMKSVPKQRNIVYDSDMTEQTPTIKSVPTEHKIVYDSDLTKTTSAIERVPTEHNTVPTERKIVYDTDITETTSMIESVPTERKLVYDSDMTETTSMIESVPTERKIVYDTDITDTTSTIESVPTERKIVYDSDMTETTSTIESVPTERKIVYDSDMTETTSIIESVPTERKIVYDSDMTEQTLTIKSVPTEHKNVYDSDMTDTTSTIESIPGEHKITSNHNSLTHNFLSNTLLLKEAGTNESKRTLQKLISYNIPGWKFLNLPQPSKFDVLEEDYDVSEEAPLLPASKKIGKTIATKHTADLNVSNPAPIRMTEEEKKLILKTSDESRPIKTENPNENLENKTLSFENFFTSQNISLYYIKPLSMRVKETKNTLGKTPSQPVVSKLVNVKIVNNTISEPGKKYDAISQNHVSVSSSSLHHPIVAVLSEKHRPLGTTIIENIDTTEDMTINLPNFPDFEFPILSSPQVEGSQNLTTTLLDVLHNKSAALKSLESRQEFHLGNFTSLTNSSEVRATDTVVLTQKAKKVNAYPKSSHSATFLPVLHSKLTVSSTVHNKYADFINLSEKFNKDMTANSSTFKYIKEEPVTWRTASSNTATTNEKIVFGNRSITTKKVNVDKEHHANAPRKVITHNNKPNTKTTGYPYRIPIKSKIKKFNKDITVNSSFSSNFKYMKEAPVTWKTTSLNTATMTSEKIVFGNRFITTKEVNVDKAPHANTRKVISHNDKPSNKITGLPYRIPIKSKIKKRAAYDALMDMIASRWSKMNNEEADFEVTGLDDTTDDRQLEFRLIVHNQTSSTKKQNNVEELSYRIKTHDSINPRKLPDHYGTHLPHYVHGKISDLCLSFDAMNRKNKSEILRSDQPATTDDARSNSSVAPILKLKRSFPDKNYRLGKIVKRKSKQQKNQRNMTPAPSESATEADQLLDTPVQFDDKLKTIIQSGWAKKNFRDPSQKSSEDFSGENTHVSEYGNQFQKQQPSKTEDTEDNADDQEEEKMILETLATEFVETPFEPFTGKYVDKPAKVMLLERLSKKTHADKERTASGQNAPTDSHLRKGSRRLVNSKTRKGSNLRDLEKPVSTMNDSEKRQKKPQIYCPPCVPVIGTKREEKSGVKTGIRVRASETPMSSSITEKQVQSDKVKHPRLNFLMAANTDFPTKPVDPDNIESSISIQMVSDKENFQKNLSGEQKYLTSPVESSSENSILTMKQLNRTISTSKPTIQRPPTKDNVMKHKKKPGKRLFYPSHTTVSYSQKHKQLQMSIENFKRIARLNWEVLKNMDVDDGFPIAEFDPDLLSFPTPKESTERANLSTEENTEAEQKTLLNQRNKKVSNKSTEENAFSALEKTPLLGRKHSPQKCLSSNENPPEMVYTKSASHNNDQEIMSVPDHHSTPKTILMRVYDKLETPKLVQSYISENEQDVSIENGSETSTESEPELSVENEQEIFTETEQELTSGQEPYELEFNQQRQRSEEENEEVFKEDYEYMEETTQTYSFHKPTKQQKTTRQKTPDVPVPLIEQQMELQNSRYIKSEKQPELKKTISTRIPTTLDSGNTEATRIMLQKDTTPQTHPQFTKKSELYLSSRSPVIQKIAPKWQRTKKPRIHAASSTGHLNSVSIDNQVSTVKYRAQELQGLSDLSTGFNMKEEKDGPVHSWYNTEESRDGGTSETVQHIEEPISILSPQNQIRSEKRRFYNRGNRPTSRLYGKENVSPAFVPVLTTGLFSSSGLTRISTTVAIDEDRLPSINDHQDLRSRRRKHHLKRRQQFN